MEPELSMPGQKYGHMFPRPSSPASAMQEWEKANSSHTAIPFEREYAVRGEPGASVFKQNIGSFTLQNGAAVHIQSFGMFNMTLWDDVMTQFMPLTPRDIILVGGCRLSFHYLVKSHVSNCTVVLWKIL